MFDNHHQMDHFLHQKKIRFLDLHCYVVNLLPDLLKQTDSFRKVTTAADELIRL